MIDCDVFLQDVEGGEEDWELPAHLVECGRPFWELWRGEHHVSVTP